MDESGRGAEKEIFGKLKGDRRVERSDPDEGGACAVLVPEESKPGSIGKKMVSQADNHDKNGGPIPEREPAKIDARKRGCKNGFRFKGDSPSIRAV